MSEKYAPAMGNALRLLFAATDDKTVSFGFRGTSRVSSVEHLAQPRMAVEVGASDIN